MNEGRTPGQNPQNGRAEQTEIAEGPQQQPRIEEQPEPAPAHVEGQRRQGQGQHQAEQRVHDPGGPGPPAAGRPQQIVDQAQGRAQSAGEQELRRLQRDRQLHQPNSRDQNPPPVRWSSS